MKSRLTVAALLVAGCAARADFGTDVALLKKHNDVIVLSDKSGKARVAVVPGFQGRVMTSTNGGMNGMSFGWIHKKNVAENKRQPHINVFGGEDRIWLGPEGGQFSLFFPKGKSFTFENWQTPAAFDWGAWKTVKKNQGSATFSHSFSLTNYSGTKLDIRADREVRLVNASVPLTYALPADVKAVAFETDNRVTNVGKSTWTKTTGAPSIWILGMLQPSPATTVVIPFETGSSALKGPIVNDAYFGKVPASNLQIDQKKGVMYFKADGKKRSKIGVPPARARAALGSYDAANKVLTIVTRSTHPGARDYVNSMWEIQKSPFAGDAVNSYNDGPLEDGSQMGPFYEIESSSPAAFLKPGQTMRHIHTTIHLQGSEKSLDAIARKTFGVGLMEITSALTAIHAPAGKTAPQG